MKNTKIPKNKGITLIALIVTIVILIILATISINTVLGENGIIRKSQEAKEMYNNSTITEQKAMEQLLEEYDNAIAEPQIYNDNTLPVSPKLTNGMVKIKYNSTSEKWEKVTDDSTQWYNYANKEWANVVLVGTNGKDATGNVDVFNSDGTLNEDSAYTQLVWIPRYAYQITSQYHTESSTAGDISIVFIDTTNRDKEGTEYTTEYPNATPGVTTGMDDFVVHPAFDYGGTHLSGFWIGKFESSNTNCTTDIATGQIAYTGNEVMTVKANVTSWRYISIGNSFTACLNMNKEGNPYGLSASDNVVDPHLIKNDEWGAVAYLSKSVYGKNSEVFNNNNSSYITGIAADIIGAASSTSSTNTYNTTAGMQASTTGNITGVYDMSGGTWERVAAYITNGHANLTTNGGDLTLEDTENKYRNVYSSTVSDGSDAQEADYLLATPANGHYGDAVYETSGLHMNTNSWYSDYSNFPHSERVFFDRGSGHTDETHAGIFFFGRSSGNAAYNGSFRIVLPVF